MPKILSELDVREFRGQLCDAAEKLFAEQGEQFSIRTLAGALGVSAMTPYRYFRDKDDILAAVRARAFDRFADALEKAYAAPDGSLEKMRAVGKAYVRFAFEEPAAYRLMFDLRQPGESLYPDLVRAGERARTTMVRHIRPLIEAGVLEGEPDLIGHVMWAALHGAVVLQMAGKLGPACSFERIVEESLKVFLRGFAAEGTLG